MIGDRNQKNLSLLLSLLFVTELEMGYDPTVHRIMFKDKIRYVYNLTQESRRDAAFLNDQNNLQPPDCVHQWEEDAGMEGDPSYWLGRVKRERRQRSCIKRCLA